MLALLAAFFLSPAFAQQVGIGDIDSYCHVDSGSYPTSSFHFVKNGRHAEIDNHPLTVRGGLYVEPYQNLRIFVRTMSADSSLIINIYPNSARDTLDYSTVMVCEGTRIPYKLRFNRAGFPIGTTMERQY